MQALIIQVIIALIVGGFIGVEREYHKHVGGIGLRTTAFITLFGAMSSFFAEQFSSVYILLLGLACVILFSVSLFWYRAKKQKKIGLTSSITAVIAFFLGVMINLGMEKEAVVIAVIVFAMLFTKKEMMRQIKRLTDKEIINAIEFAVIAFVIFPFIPDKEYFFINPRDVWEIVIIISVVSFIGFLVMRFLGKTRGTLLMSISGAIFSTTAVIVSLISRYKGKKSVSKLVIASVWIASSVLIIRNMFFAFALTQSMDLLLISIKYAAIVVAYFLIMFHLMIKKLPKDNKPLITESPFAIKPAIYLGIVFSLIVLFSSISVKYFGTETFFLISFIGGMASGMATAATAVLMFASGSISSATLVFSVLFASIGGLVADALVIYMFKESKLSGEFIKFIAPLFIILLIITSFGI